MSMYFYGFLKLIIKINYPHLAGGRRAPPIPPQELEVGGHRPLYLQVKQHLLSIGKDSCYCCCSVNFSCPIYDIGKFPKRGLKMFLIYFLSPELTEIDIKKSFRKQTMAANDNPPSPHKTQEQLRRRRRRV